MAGKNSTQQKLNHTLKKIVQILHQEQIKDWCVIFGTLLGIVREGGCINKDNDIDILINCDIQKLKTILTQNKLSSGSPFREGKQNTFLKTQTTDELASIDFYIYEVDESGKIYIPWTENNIGNCYVDPIHRKFVEIKWNDTILHLPNNYEEKLVSMYGDWKTPGSSRCPTNFDF